MVRWRALEKWYFAVKTIPNEKYGICINDKSNSDCLKRRQMRVCAFKHFRSSITTSQTTVIHRHRVGDATSSMHPNTSRKMMGTKGAEAFIMRCFCIRAYERVYTRGLVCVALRAREIKRLGRRYARGLRGGAAQRSREFTAVYGCFRGCLRSVRNWENQEASSAEL